MVLSACSMSVACLIRYHVVAQSVALQEKKTEHQRHIYFHLEHVPHSHLLCSQDLFAEHAMFFYNPTSGLTVGVVATSEVRVNMWLCLCVCLCVFVCPRVHTVGRGAA